MSTATVPPMGTIHHDKPTPPLTVRPVESKEKIVKHRVLATREGLMGQRTASGYLVEVFASYCALPSWNALRRFIRISNPANGRSTIAQVLDVGPWNENDDRYVFGGEKPAAESGRDTRNRRTNLAGIDIGEAAWKALGMTGNSDVEWEFIS